MKATRLFLAAVALAFASACTSADLTGPSAVDLQPSFNSGAACSDPDPSQCDVGQQGQHGTDNRGQHGTDN